MRFKIWNKILSITGFVTLQLGYFVESRVLIIIGGISTILGIATAILK